MSKNLTGWFRSSTSTSTGTGSGGRRVVRQGTCTGFSPLSVFKWQRVGVEVVQVKAVGRRLVRQGTCPGGVRQVTLLVIGLVLGLAAKLVQVQSVGWGAGYRTRWISPTLCAPSSPSVFLSQKIRIYPLKIYVTPWSVNGFCTHFSFLRFLGPAAVKRADHSKHRSGGVPVILIGIC